MVLAIYRRLPHAPERGAPFPRAHPLRQSRRIVLALAALFSLDAFAGGFVVQSLLALWLFDRFGLSLTTAGMIFFWTGVLSAFSYFAAARIADRIGLVNTMVFAASMTAVPRSLAAAVSPMLSGTMLAAASFGWPLIQPGFEPRRFINGG